MGNLIATVGLTIAVLLGSAGVSWSADFQKGLAAYKSRNYATAAREWTPLAEQGDAEAQFNLGVLYERGKGVLKDNVYAHIWWSIAASSWNRDAIKNRDNIAGKLSEAELEKALDLARSCARSAYKGC